MYIKKHESPRKQGRNSKGKNASARLRQLKKRDKMLKNKLKGNSPFFFIFFLDKCVYCAYTRYRTKKIK